MRAFALLILAAATATPAFAQDTTETPIEVPSPIPKGFLLAWKPTLLSVRIDSGTKPEFGSETVEPLRMLARYTTTGFGEKFMLRGEIEGGRFQTDTQGVNLGSDGYDLVLRLLGGTATRVTPEFTIIASAGFLTRYQRGRASGGAPELGMAGVTSNVEFEYRLAPLITLGLFFEGGLTPFPYASQARLGLLSDASEFKVRGQVSVDVARNLTIDVGYDYTRWHAAFTQSAVFDPAGDKAVLVETREHSLTVGFRFR